MKLFSKVCKLFQTYVLVFLVRSVWVETVEYVVRVDDFESTSRPSNWVCMGTTDGGCGSRLALSFGLTATKFGRRVSPAGWTAFLFGLILDDIWAFSRSCLLFGWPGCWCWTFWSSQKTQILDIELDNVIFSCYTEISDYSKSTIIKRFKLIILSVSKTIMIHINYQAADCKMINLSYLTLSNCCSQQWILEASDKENLHFHFDLTGLLVLRKDQTTWYKNYQQAIFAVVSILFLTISSAIYDFRQGLLPTCALLELSHALK